MGKILGGSNGCSGKNSCGGMKKGPSAKVHEPSGSGSRPTKSKFETPTSAPKDMHSLDSRKPSGPVLK